MGVPPATRLRARSYYKNYFGCPRQEIRIKGDRISGLYYNPNISRLQVGYNLFTKSFSVSNSWDILVVEFWRFLVGMAKSS